MKNIGVWIDKAGDNDQEKLFRQAVHLILLAISRDRGLSRSLVVKGGIALSIIYSSERFTTDIDLSSLDNIQTLTKDDLENALSRQLIAVVALSDYDIALNIHSIKLQPKHLKAANATFPSYKVSIGYARKTDSKAMARLNKKEALNTVTLDISFNESLILDDTEDFQIDDSYHILLYKLEQLIAEKYRSILQQVKRRRNRRQDIYDIAYLLDSLADDLDDEEMRLGILKRLIKSSEGKGIENYLNSKAFRDKEIKERSLKDFDTLSDEIEIEETAESQYKKVQDFFESLPWDELLKN